MTKTNNKKNKLYKSLKKQSTQTIREGFKETGRFELNPK